MSIANQSFVKKGIFNYRGRNFSILALSLLGIAFSIGLYLILAKPTEFPQFIIDLFPFADWVNEAQRWMEQNIKHITRAISNLIKIPLEALEEKLWELPWFLIFSGFVLISLAYGGLRLALLVAFGVLFWGMVDMWFEAMSTLSLMSVSVFFSAAIGIMLGIAASQSDRFEAFIRPILDTMQTMPAFVYLIPAIFFFGIGATSATMAIIIYALPPIVRLTNLGIRQVPAPMIEAAQSYGTTRLQMLLKVQLPQALPSIMLGINQTIMMALGLAVLAVFIGGGGLGEEVWKAIVKLKVGWAFEGGVCIVFMAILFDRLSYAISGVSSGQEGPAGVGPQFLLLPQKWDEYPLACAIERPISAIWNYVSKTGQTITNFISRLAGNTKLADWIIARPFLVVGGMLLLIIYFIGPEIRWMNSFPSFLEISIREPIDFVIDWLTVNPYFIAVTKFIRSSIFLYLLDPLDKFLVGLPWWYVMIAVGGIVWASVSAKFAVMTMLFLFFLAAAGLWEISLFTLAGTAVSVILCMVMGVPLGIAAAYSKALDSIIRPILDAMQTLPAFVYLIPALFFFGGNKTTAVIATVIYSIPPVIRLTTLGLRQLPPEINEVSNSYGSSTFQTLLKVKLPMASPSIMLGLNQAVVFALAMQAITPLIGGQGLGKEVFDAMNKADMGKGLAGGIGIVLLTIMLDQLTQGWTKRQRKALGL